MIDLIFAILMIIAIIKGYQKGFIIAIFSIIAFIVGLAAALKLSAVVAGKLQNNLSISSHWLPFISFALVFFLVVFLVHLGGKLIQSTFEMALLGWANRLGGVILYVVLYTIIFSVFLFYTTKINIFSPAAIRASKTYPIVVPIAPKVLDGFGRLIPYFKDSFARLEDFFKGVSHKIDQ